MSGILLVIDRRESVLRLDGRSLRVDTPAQSTKHFPLGPLELVVIHGGAMVASDVWRALAERCIPAVLLPGRGRGSPAFLGAGLSASVDLRSLQHLGADNENHKLSIAKALVAAKLIATRALLIEHNDYTDDELKRINDAITNTSQTESCNALMGIEGNAASLWF